MSASTDIRPERTAAALAAASAADTPGGGTKVEDGVAALTLKADAWDTVEAAAETASALAAMLLAEEASALSSVSNLSAEDLFENSLRLRLPLRLRLLRWLRERERSRSRR